MRFQCGSSLCSFGAEGLATVLEAGVDEGPNTTEEVSDVNESESAILGSASIFKIFFIDEL